MGKNEPKKLLEEYFPEIDLGMDDLSIGGYIFANISIFDHWLTEVEASENEVLTYRGAVEAEALDKYIEGEQKFLSFYRLLAKDGIICNRPGPRRAIAVTDSQLETIFIDSLRERRFMDVYFTSESVRVMGRWDRTDLVFFESKAHMAVFQEKVERAGLFLLADAGSGVTH